MLDYYQSSAVREYRVHEGDKLHMECNAPRSLPNATFSWSIARDVDTRPFLLKDTRRMQIGSNGSQLFLYNQGLNTTTQLLSLRERDLLLAH